MHSYETNEYLHWHAWRFSVLPGLTSLCQVSSKSKLNFQQTIRMDITYENRMSLWLEFGSF